MKPQRYRKKWGATEKLNTGINLNLKENMWVNVKYVKTIKLMFRRF